MTSQGLRALGFCPATACATEIPQFLVDRRKIQFAWKLGPDWRSSELELIAFRHTSTAENLGLDDDPDSQMKKVAEAAHPDFAVLVPKLPGNFDF